MPTAILSDAAFLIEAYQKKGRPLISIILSMTYIFYLAAYYPLWVFSWFTKDEFARRHTPHVYAYVGTSIKCHDRHGVPFLLNSRAATFP